MPKGSSIRHHMIHGATNEDAVDQLRHLHRQQRLRHAVVVRPSSIEWEEGRHDIVWKVDRVKDVPHGDAVGGCVDERNSGAVAADKETSGVVITVDGGAEAAGEWVERIKSSLEGVFQVTHDEAMLLQEQLRAAKEKTLLDRTMWKKLELPWSQLHPRRRPPRILRYYRSCGDEPNFCHFSDILSGAAPRH